MEATEGADVVLERHGVSRTRVSTAHLTGTLVGACAMLLVGRAIDHLARAG
ncbi:hypothetical protein [Streptomyces sp. NPDC048385]|uniref:hypothetical protein n=1 Tax=unclassified Streptomyces TaxID=2593676 RepID=UPI003423445C